MKVNLIRHRSGSTQCTRSTETAIQDTNTTRYRHGSTNLNTDTYIERHITYKQKYVTGVDYKEVKKMKNLVSTKLACLNSFSLVCTFKSVLERVQACPCLKHV